jgi:hypothetical protein
VPAIVACPLVLLASTVASFLFFAALERLLVHRSGDATRLRHRLLAVASFCAFNLFYVFAGQPTLLEYPIVDRIVAFVVPVVSTLALAQRWNVEPTRTARRLPVV